jgi:hypothetical protein
MKLVRQLSAIAEVSLFFRPGFAQKLVDPNAVAPEFRAVAENNGLNNSSSMNASKRAMTP